MGGAEYLNCVLLSPSPSPHGLVIVLTTVPPNCTFPALGACDSNVSFRDSVVVSDALLDGRSIPIQRNLGASYAPMCWSENWRLKEEIADHAKVLAELEAAQAQKVSRLQDQECKDASCDQDIQIRIPKLKDLESKAKELRKSSLRLQIEKSDLAQ
ncbi:hypothetical protein JHK84_041220 [Glycine max]|nr:hypothetical protein JHK85_041624 [Glycine max]KAG5122880.1 hypothetical protein JHK84_041220 [Glycine max]